MHDMLRGYYIYHHSALAQAGNRGGPRLETFKQHKLSVHAAPQEGMRHPLRAGSSNVQSLDHLHGACCAEGQLATEV